MKTDKSFHRGGAQGPSHPRVREAGISEIHGEVVRMVDRGAHAQKDVALSQQGQVGVFWLYKGDLLMDCVPLSEAEPYGTSLLYPRGHAGVWRYWQMQGHVPDEIDYDDLPRGRVSLMDGRFVVLAHACILRDELLIVAIISELELPRDRTELRTDSHYRCKACLRRPN